MASSIDVPTGDKGITDQKEVSGNVDEKKSNHIPWAELIKRTFQIDITLCKKCGGRLRVISMIKKADTIKTILEHLGLGADPPAYLHLIDNTMRRGWV